MDLNINYDDDDDDGMNGWNLSQSYIYRNIMDDWVFKCIIFYIHVYIYLGIM